MPRPVRGEILRSTRIPKDNRVIHGSMRPFKDNRPKRDTDYRHGSVGVVRRCRKDLLDLFQSEPLNQDDHRSRPHETADVPRLARILSRRPTHVFEFGCSRRRRATSYPSISGKPMSSRINWGLKATADSSATWLKVSPPVHRDRNASKAWPHCPLHPQVVIDDQHPQQRFRPLPSFL